MRNLIYCRISDIRQYIYKKEVSMKKKVTLVITAGITAFLLGSCFSLPGSGSGGALGGLTDSLNKRVNAEVASATGLTGMTRKMMFNMVYAQVFFTGGFGANFYELEETQGTTWRIQSRDENGNVSQVEAERALLKKLPNGDEWWYLSWRADADNIEFEALMRKDLQPRKIRYYNEDVKRVEEAVFKENAGSAGEDPPPEPAASDMNLSDLSKLSVGKETIKINSGTYTADKLQWTVVNEDDKATYNYVWWVDPKTSGGLVKYEWTKSGSKESLNGELYSIKKGYTTKFSSF